MALFRVAFITTYLSPPLTSGFTTAAALYIAARCELRAMMTALTAGRSQLPNWLGIDTTTYSGFVSLFQTIIVRRSLCTACHSCSAQHILGNLTQINWVSFAIGLACSAMSRAHHAHASDSHDCAVRLPLLQQRRLD